MTTGLVNCARRLPATASVDSSSVRVSYLGLEEGFAMVPLLLLFALAATAGFVQSIDVSYCWFVLCPDDG